MSTSVQVTAKLPNDGASHTFAADSQDSVSLLQQYVLSLGVLTQPTTAFSLAFRGEPLAGDVLLESLVGDQTGEETPNVVLDMVPQRLTLADVQLQLDQVREALGLRSVESTYVNSGATRLHEIKKGSKKHRKMGEEELAELAEVPDTASLTAEIRTADQGQFTIANVSASEPNPLIPKPAAQELSFARWQPLCRSPQLKLRGILAFIYLRANNGQELFYVATSQGFAYLPTMTATTYAEPTANTVYAPSLVQILEQTSPTTISHARKNQEKIKEDMLGCMNIPQVASVAPWLVKVDPKRAPFPSNVDQLAANEVSTVPDWNEDFQSSREISADLFSEKIGRDRSLCSTATDFANAAVQGATKIVEGAVKALNPDEASETSKIYLDQGIFYTHGADFVTAYAAIANPHGARKAVKKGVQGVEQLMLYNSQELSPVLTAVVDYCGRSIVAQAPVPGIFREVPLIVYGFSEDRETMHFDERINGLLADFAAKLHLKPHPVNREGVETQVSAEIHCAKSTDGRDYIIDLHRLFVPDLLSADAELNLLRSEAVKTYFSENPEAPLLNPDVWMSAEELPAEYAANEFPKDIEAATNVAKFVRETLVSRFVSELAAGDITSNITEPIDGIHLTSLLHRNGINMRMLGLVYAKATEAGLRNLSAVVLEEAIARAAKFILRNQLAEVVGLENVGPLVEEFLAKLVNKDASLVTEIENRLRSHFKFDLPNDWSANFSRPSLVRLIALKCGLQLTASLKLVAINPTIKYSFPLSSSAQEAMEAALISLGTAVLDLRKHKEVVAEKEQNSKDSQAEASQVEESKTEEAQAEAESAATEEELIDAANQSLVILVQALGVYTQVYGSAHSEVAHAFNKVAASFCEHGNDITKAIDFARKAITIAERVSGIDSYDVIIMYNNLAFFEQLAGNIGTSLALTQRVLAMYREIAWPGHRDNAARFGAVGTMLLRTSKQKLQERAVPWLLRAVDLAKDTAGGPSGHVYFQLAQSQLLAKDLKNASRSMEAAYKSFKAQLGPDSDSAKETKAYLEHLLKITLSEEAGQSVFVTPKETKSAKKRNNKKKKSKAKAEAAA